MRLHNDHVQTCKTEKTLWDKVKVIWKTKYLEHQRSIVWKYNCNREKTNWWVGIEVEAKEERLCKRKRKRNLKPKV